VIIFDVHGNRSKYYADDFILFISLVMIFLRSISLLLFLLRSILNQHIIYCVYSSLFTELFGDALFSIRFYLRVFIFRSPIFLKFSFSELIGNLEMNRLLSQLSISTSSFFFVLPSFVILFTCYKFSIWFLDDPFRIISVSINK